MRRLRIILLLLLAPSIACLAQYPNNWVQYNQQYYKISVAATGIYRLTFEQLQAAGVPVNSLDPRMIQVYHRGTEQAIAFKHNQLPADTKFEAGEYLEFYGERNDGEMDAKLYQPASVQPHKFFNLFSDTAAYFLTVNPLPVLGKRMDLDDQVNSTGIPKDTYHHSEQLRTYVAEYSGGYTADSFVAQSYFDEGEGWTGATICTVNAGCEEQRDFPIDQLANGVTSRPPPTLDIQLTGREALTHRAEIYVGATISTMRLLTTRTFVDFQTPVVTQTLQWSDIGADGKMIVRVKAIGAGTRDRLSVSYIKVRFAQNFNFASATSKYMELIPNMDGKSYIEMDNAPATTRVWDITDINNIIQVGTRTNAGVLSAIISNTSSPRKLYAASTFMVPDVSQIKPVKFRDLQTSAQFIIITHRSLMKPALTYSDPIRAFAEYRASDIGGGYDTLTVTVDQLYDQFNYGETSPTAIYEFMRYMVGEGDPQYLFLVGKGRDVSSAAHRRLLSANESKDLVPPAGNPGSDMMFTAGLKGEPFVPAVATGRLTASTAIQVASYLNKVKETEATPFNQLWRKRVLHLSGGIQPAELVRFRGYMHGFEEIASGDYLGGDVVTISKHGTDQIENINVSTEVNNGVDLITFFGHSAPNVTDIDIGDVSDPLLGYNNAGKYPIIFVNGCNAGEYFNNGESFGENWTLTNNKGARNFIANSSYGFELALREYTNYFYQVGFADSLFLTKGIGDVQKEVARRFMNDFGNARSTYSAQATQMVLLGDPSLRMFGAHLPDFETSDPLVNVVSFDGKPIHALSDSLQLQITTNNLGRATKQKMKVKVVHTIGNAGNTYVEEFNSVKFQETLNITLRRDAGNFYGNNKIQVFIDPDDDIGELNEDNNVAQWTKFIQFNGTQNLQPANFGIVTTTDLKVLFQDTDVLSGEKTYQTQLDTTRSFNSPFLQSKTVTGTILLKSNFQLLDKDSTVYYWRSKPTDKSEDEWENTSFSYIKNGPNGWTQLAFHQMLANSFAGLVPDENKRKLEFEKTHVSVSIKTFGDENTTPGITPSVLIENAEYYYSPQSFTCRTNTINLISFDRSSVVPYLGVQFTFQNSFGRSCGREPQLINSFTSTEVDTGSDDDLIQYIDNMKVSDSVVLFTVGDPGFASWSNAVKTKLGEIGIQSTDINAFLPGEPIIILGRKGAAPGTARIIRSDDAAPKEQEIQLSEELTGFLSTGKMSSVIIGPSLGWHSITPRMKFEDPTDMAGVDVYLVDKLGNETVHAFNQQTELSIEAVNANDFPYLRLVFRTTDDVTLTPAKLRNWTVSYDPAPDGLLIPGEGVTPVTLPESVDHTSSFAFINISNVDFVDSLRSSFSVVNRDTRLRETQQFNIKGPAAGDTVRFSRTINTLNKVGFNDLSAAVNTEFVTEQYFQNNTIELASFLEVQKDRQNPVMQVTVDGRYLSDGDFVSANPLIKVTLRDDNTIRMLKDTTTLRVFMSDACDDDDCDLKRINFSRSDVKWNVTADGEVQVEFTPKNLEEGVYLLYAEGEDVSGNPAGEGQYRISFVVDRDQGMIFAPPYPNPSQAGFYFDFTAIGERAPDSFVLTIIDRQGRDIATFTEQDANPLRIGINQMRWAGTDSNGNRLSEGLYFYQLIVRSGESQYKNSGSLMIVR